MMENKKNPDYDIEKMRPVTLQLGIICSIALSMIFIEFTSFSVIREPKDLTQTQNKIPEDILYEIPPPPSEIKREEIKLTTPKTDNKEITPARFIQPKSIPLVTDFIITKNEIDPGIQSRMFGADEEPGEINLNFGYSKDTSGFVEEEFALVEDMPYFPSCEKITDRIQREQCTLEKIYEEIRKNIVYPFMMLELGITGTVYVSFRVNTKGLIDDIQIMKSANKEFDDEALRVVKLLPPMIPGKQRGKTVNVRYTVPINFNLN